MSKTKSVIDINGVRYELTGLLGQGGQGAVYAVKGGKLAVKVIRGSDPVRRERLRNQLSHVRRLPLHDLCLAKPLEILREPYIGYVMELLTDMVPIQTMLTPPKGTTSIHKWYKQTGGLRRRLKILGKVANILARLHGKGLAYSDPSPANIFISKDPGYNEVWFIDTDNLCYESGVQKEGVYSPKYGAPELVRGTAGVSTLTDVHAFAVIAFQVLTLVHPFIGDYVNDGDPELEEQALAGHIPWVEDTEDDINRANFGIPRTWALSKMLREMFGKSFGAGRTAPTARPGAAEWSARLLTAADSTITCPECGGTYYSEYKTCTWCDTSRPAILKVVFCLWDPTYKKHGGILHKPENGKEKPVVVDQLTVCERESFAITRRLAFNELNSLVDEPVLLIEFSNNKIHLTSLDGREYWLMSFSGKDQTCITERKIGFAGNPGVISWLLHFGTQEKQHRVIIFFIKAKVLYEDK